LTTTQSQGSGVPNLGGVNTRYYQRNQRVAAKATIKARSEGSKDQGDIWIAVDPKATNKMTGRCFHNSAECGKLKVAKKLKKISVCKECKGQKRLKTE